MKNIKLKIMVNIFTGVVIFCLMGGFSYLLLKKNILSKKPILVRVPHENRNLVKNQTPPKITGNISNTNENRIVSPTYGLDQLIEKVANESIEDADRLIELQSSKNRYLELKRQGHTFWQSEMWMKEVDYYRGIDTISLTNECFQRPIFFMEMTVFDDPAYAFQRLEIFHNGFSELFQRDDLWKGILHFYYKASENISLDCDFETTNLSSLQLSELRCIYSYPPFKKQLKGHEQDFLAANIAVLKKYIDYLDAYDPKKFGQNSDESPFLYAPCSVAEVALMLTKQVNPQQYTNIENGIKSIRWKQINTVKEVKEYLELIVACTEKQIIK